MKTAGDRHSKNHVQPAWRKQNFWRALWSKKVHPAWILAAVSAAFLLGVGLCGIFPTAIFGDMFFAIAACFVIILCVISRKIVALILAILAGILLGLWRGSLATVDVSAWKGLVGRQVELSGIVAQDPSLTSGGNLGLTLENVAILDDSNNEIELPGKIFVTVPSANSGIARSDEVEVSGSVKSGFGSFPASMSYAQLDKITARPGADPAREARDMFGQKLREVVPSPAADLGMGILMGQKTALPAALSAAFIAASLTHIVVASGYNLTILIRFCRRLFAKISRFAALSFSALLVFGFANITGFSPSMTRASLVAFLSLVAWYYGRKFHPISLLLYTAAITIMIEPTDLWGDAGWWMSFLSFAGVLIFAPLVRAYLWGDEKDPQENWSEKSLPENLDTKVKQKTNKPSKSKNHLLRDTLVETFSAQLFSAPIIALMMGQLSPFGLLANLLVLPVVPLAMFLSFIAGIASFIFPHFLAQIVALPATWLLNYIIGVTNLVADFPNASQPVSVGVGVIMAIFVAIAAITLILKWQTKHNFYDDNFVE